MIDSLGACLLIVYHCTRTQLCRLAKGLAQFSPLRGTSSSALPLRGFCTDSVVAV